MASRKVLNNEVLEFDDWMQLVDVRCQMLAEESVYDLPDHNYQEMYDQGWTVDFAAKVATQGEVVTPIDWSKAPGFAMFHTFDEDGKGLWHQYHPHFKQNPFGGYWESKLFVIDSHLKMPDGLNWGNSLTERPK